MRGYLESIKGHEEDSLLLNVRTILVLNTLVKDNPEVDGMMDEVDKIVKTAVFMNFTIARTLGKV